jgi:hypothetical protein
LSDIIRIWYVGREWQTPWKFWKRRIALLMVTYHYFRFYVTVTGIFLLSQEHSQWDQIYVFKILFNCTVTPQAFVPSQFVDVIIITVHDLFWNVGQANCILK